MSRVAGGPVLPIAECFAEMTRICGVANRSANLVSSRRRVRYTRLFLPAPFKLLCYIRHRIHSLTLLCRFALVAS
jgi:hypothetical protein